MAALISCSTADLISKEAQPRESREADWALPGRQLVPGGRGLSEDRIAG
jgi:hypothetical protein